MTHKKMVNSITELIGDTPAVRINRLVGAGCCRAIREAGVFQSKRQRKRSSCM